MSLFQITLMYLLLMYPYLTGHLCRTGRGQSLAAESISTGIPASVSGPFGLRSHIAANRAGTGTV